jgi:hypothetical protein
MGECLGAELDESVGVRREIVGDQQPAGAQRRDRQVEQAEVVVLLGVDEDEVRPTDKMGKALSAVAFPEFDHVLRSRAVANVPRARESLDGSTSKVVTRPPVWRAAVASQRVE